ncbi:MAG: transaldolase [Bacteroidota bacterium]
MRKFLLFFTLAGIFSCVEKESVGATVYFTGEIVNPTNDFVVLFRDDMVVDSARLDENNRFSFQLDSIKQGLHHFDHSPQQQYVYLEEGDSVVIRLNASPAYFDESLVFSGDNEEVNNFMIEMFLTYEDEEPLVYSYYRLSPQDFSDKIDSLRLQKLDELEQLSATSELSEAAYTMSKAAIDYHSFLYKEKYPFYHKKKTGKTIIHELDTAFYKHRKNLDLNNGELSFFRPYYDFVKHHFGNLSYTLCNSLCGIEEFATAKQQLHMNQHKIALIDSLVTAPKLRDNLFRNVAMDYLLKVHSANEECDSFIKKYEKLSKSEAHIEEINHLYKGIQNLQPQRQLPDLVVEDGDGKAVSLMEIAKGNTTVFYFWTSDQKRHFRNVTRHIEKLRKLHPHHQFVGISLRTTRADWLSLLEENRIPSENQYRSTDFRETQNALIVDGLSKCVISEDTLIVNAFANVFTSFPATASKE